MKRTCLLPELEKGVDGWMGVSDAIVINVSEHEKGEKQKIPRSTGPMSKHLSRRGHLPGQLPVG